MWYACPACFEGRRISINMVIYIGADHRGFKLKEELKKFLEKRDYQVVDVGNHVYDPEDDYPDFALAAAKKVAADPGSRGIVLCGSGVGVDVVANRFKGVRSALAFSVKQAIMSRTDDDTNVLSIPADFMTKRQARKITEVWLRTAFSGAERHRRRIDKIEKLK